MTNHAERDGVGADAPLASSSFHGTGGASSAAKHTPGPWFTHPHIIRDHGGRKPIFSDGLWVIKSDPELNALAVVDYADDHDPGTRAEAEANARLIAAAPDLLEALDWLLSSVTADPASERYPGDREERLELASASARAAILAATGE